LDDSEVLKNNEKKKKQIEELLMRSWDVFNYPGRKFPLAIGVFHDLSL
jgi:hypothetical protein